MLHIPILRKGAPYKSIDVARVPHFKTRETFVEVSQANAGLIRRDLLDLDETRALLTAFVRVCVGGTCFEEACIVETAIGVLLRGDEEKRQRRGAHAIEFAGDRVGDEHVLAAAAEGFGLRA